LKKYRIIISGGRDFKDWELLRMKVSYYLLTLEPKDVEIVSGGCRGADKLGERYAQEYGYPVTPFYVSREDWTKYGKAAGPIRNGKMAKYATHLIAFWREGDDGTENVIKQSERAGLSIRVVHY
jgi:YspA, cpYpsA-related SLOG family